ncbi:MAG: ABC transporter permease [Candidatus Hodarchaeota archaeon]
MSMIKYIIRRLLAMIPVLFGVLTLTFILSRYMPGDPVLAYLPEGRVTPEVYNYWFRQLGLDRPIYEQYFRYLGDLFTGNWGISVSIARGMNVWDLIMVSLPRTVDISILSIIIAAFVGIKTGVISARHRNKAKDTIFRGMSLVGVAVPVFFLGMLLQYALGYLWPIFPTTGFKTYSYPDPPLVTGFRWIDALISQEIYMITDYLYHLILPVFCLSFISLAGVVRQTRSSMLEVLEQDYVRTARAKGCKERDVINTHARKNAMIPTVTVIGLSFAGLLSGAVLTETTFGLYGIGQLLVQSIRNSDYWVLNGLVFFFSIIFVTINLITDLIYGMLDPRIRY